MEVTGQAFEDMQEQNSRLIQQLREKDDANFKLMSERIKAQQVNKLQREEKDMLVEQVGLLSLLLRFVIIFHFIIINVGRSFEAKVGAQE